MEQFNQSEEYKYIISDLKQFDIINDVCTFECFTDGIATFSLIKDKFYHEFSFITDRDFMREMEVDELLTLKGLIFFGHRIFNYENNECNEFLDSITWTMRRPFKLN